MHRANVCPHFTPLNVLSFFFLQSYKKVSGQTPWLYHWEKSNNMDCCTTLIPSLYYLNVSLKHLLQICGWKVIKTVQWLQISVRWFLFCVNLSLLTIVTTDLCRSIVSSLVGFSWILRPNMSVSSFIRGLSHHSHHQLSCCLYSGGNCLL